VIQDFMVLIGILSLIALQMHSFADDPGVGWHLKTGEYILDTGHVPTEDPFLYYTEPRKWVSDQWLSDVFLSSLHARGSWPLVYGVLTVIFLFIFFFFLYRGAVNHTGSLIASSFSTLLAFKLAQIHFILRPVMFGFLLFTLVYLKIFKLHTSLQNDGTRAALIELKYAYFFLPPLFMLWANLHPSFILGLLFICLLPAALIAEKILFEQSSGSLNTRFFLLLFGLPAICFLATLINPYFLELHTSILALGSNEFFMNYHMEWQSPDFKAFEGLLFQIILLIIVASYFFADERGRRIPIFEFLILVIFAVLAARSVRMLPYFGIVASIPLVFAFTNLQYARIFSKSAVFRRLAKAFCTLEKMESRGLRGTHLLIICSLGLLLSSSLYASLPGFSGDFGPTRDKFPYEAIEHLKKKYAEESVVIASTPAWGGFITFQGPTLKPLIDDRNTMLGEDFYKAYYLSMRDPHEFIRFAQELNASYILLPARELMGNAITAASLAEVEFRDPVSLLLKLNKTENSQPL